MNKMSIKKDDLVAVLSGKDKRASRARSWRSCPRAARWL